MELENKSFQGRRIGVLEITRNVKNGDDGRPVFFLGAVHHAREWPAAESAMEFAWDLLLNHGSDPKLARILDEVRVVIMPLTNPDGFISSRTAMDPDERHRDRRVPDRRQTSPTGARTATRCVDHQRRRALRGGDRRRQQPQLRHGLGRPGRIDLADRPVLPRHRPELRAGDEGGHRAQLPAQRAGAHLDAQRRRARCCARRGSRPTASPRTRSRSRPSARRWPSPTGYVNEYGWQLYDTTGTTKDWGYDALGQFSYTVELGPPNGDFHGDYKTHVVEQYRPTKGALAGRGMREAYINAALYTRTVAQTGRLTGTAPAGATLRVTKDFTSETYPVCTIASPLAVDTVEPVDYCVAPGEVQEVPEHVEITMQVPESGAYTWWLNPSTRPFSDTPESYTLTCEVGGAVQHTQQVFLARGETKALDRAC